MPTVVLRNATIVGELETSPGAPSHPIAPGGQPPGIWGGAPPYVDIGFPGPQPGQPPSVWRPTFPTNPIVIPPDAISPGVPTHPIYIPVYPSQGPGFPTNPIVIPPNAIGPGVPTHPIVLPPPGSPSHPIVIPPDAIEPGVPTHPIVLPPSPPLTIWGGPFNPPQIWGGAPPYVDIGFPGPQPPAAGGGKWVFSPVYGWVIDPSPQGGKPVPPGPGTPTPETKRGG
jgi:hypothetical protein